MKSPSGLLGRLALCSSSSRCVPSHRIPPLHGSPLLWRRLPRGPYSPLFSLLHPGTYTLVRTPHTHTTPHHTRHTTHATHTTPHHTTHARAAKRGCSCTVAYGRAVLAYLVRLQHTDMGWRWRWRWRVSGGKQACFFNVQPASALIERKAGGVAWSNFVGICLFHAGNMINTWDMRQGFDKTRTPHLLCLQCHDISNRRPVCKSMSNV